MGVEHIDLHQSPEVEHVPICNTPHCISSAEFQRFPEVIGDDPDKLRVVL